MRSTDVIKLLKAHGWTVVRVRGSHHVMRSPDGLRTTIVPHPKKDLGKGLVNAILKQAGLE